LPLIPNFDSLQQSTESNFFFFFQNKKNPQYNLCLDNEVLEIIECNAKIASTAFKTVGN